MDFIREHALDIDADARRFYSMTLDEMWATMSGPQFYGLTMRLIAYQGVVASRIEHMAPPQEERKEVDLGDSALDGLISRSTV